MREIFRNLQCRVYLAWDHENRESISITGPEDVYALVRDELAGADRERFLSILLSTKNMVIGIETVGIGTINTCMVTARELFKSALLANAHSVILCHNHPSGDLTPSDKDIALTRKIVNAGEILGIEVCDHLIVGRDGFKSLKAMNLMRPNRSILSMTRRR
jgi:DNA repair protein RadC